jgi:hypothetical protein
VRARRLLIPLVVGLAVLSPFQVWIADAIGGSGLGPVEGLRAWYADVKLAPTPEWFGDYGFHLWFIAFLLVYALASMPLLAVLRRPGAERALARLAGLPAGVVAAVLLVPLLASQWLLRIPAPGYRDWADFALWLGFFWLGIVLMAERRLLGRALQAGPWLGLLGVVLTLIFIPIALSGALWDLEGSPRLGLATLGYVTLRTGVAVGLVGGCLWIGARWFTAQPGILRWASRAILPFYVIHHPVIVVVAALVVPWGIDLWLKFGLIAALSLAGTLLLTDAAMRTRLGRALFGLPRPVAAGAARPLARPPVLRETS